MQSQRDLHEVIGYSHRPRRRTIYDRGDVSENDDFGHYNRNSDKIDPLVVLDEVVTKWRSTPTCRTATKCE